MSRGETMKHLANRLVAFTCLLLILLTCSTALAREIRQPFLHDPPPETADKSVISSRDSVILLGPWSSDADFNGQFQTQAGTPDWNGWTSRDLTQVTESHWQLGTYAPNGALNGTSWAWCGDATIPSCGGLDPEGGYGNSWNEILEWRGTVADPASSVNITFDALANIDSEPGYDGTAFIIMDQYGESQFAYYEGLQTGLTINHSFTLDPEDYQGPGNDEVVLRINFQSDVAWSDEDCLHPTGGAIQIDDITVTLDQGTPVVDFADFESGWGNWDIAMPPGVGDYAQIWTGLEDIDPCSSNYTPQVAFINDGLVVPGVEACFCQNWCYGPGGYIVETGGGAMGPDGHIWNVIESPVMPWPDAELDGGLLAMDVYVHEELDPDSPGIFWVWSVRSIATGDPADIENASWRDRNFLHYGPGIYRRFQEDVSDLLESGATHVQIQLGVYQIENIWWPGHDGYPAPYYDNVRFTCYDKVGPDLQVDGIDLAQDGFPAAGAIDFVNLGNNSVRFDAARNTNNDDLPITPGDSLVVAVKSFRAGAEVVEPPVMVVAMQANDLFDPYRSIPAGFSQNGDIISGEVEGVQATHNGVPLANHWAFDLPDTGFFYPGDVIQYYFIASDDDGSTVETATLPASPAGLDQPVNFGSFGLPPSCDDAYDLRFTVRALPSLREDDGSPGALVAPAVLFWNDGGELGGPDGWFEAWANVCFEIGRDFDVYTTRDPSEGQGNGLGGRCTEDLLDIYEALFYTSGEEKRDTLSNGEPINNGDPGNDLALLDAWLRNGNKKFFLSGDNLIFDLHSYQGSEGDQFMLDWLKVTHMGIDARPLINNQTSPEVLAIPGNGFFFDNSSWVVDGGCPTINTFDAVQADELNGGVRLLEFADPIGQPGGYPYSAGTLYESSEYSTTVVSLPFDFPAISLQGAPWTRAEFLDRVLTAFGLQGIWVHPYRWCNACGDVMSTPDPDPLPGAKAFTLNCYPNPFNPVTRIQYTMPKAGHLSLKVYNMKGELVRTLIDEHVASSGAVLWDGTDEHGARVGSGVYFSRAETGGQVRIKKMALIK
jgi:hypothetical protein